MQLYNHQDIVNKQPRYCLWKKIDIYETFVFKYFHKLRQFS